MKGGDGASNFCTGTLVTPSVVLTAAHCLVDAKFEAPYEITGFYTGAGTPTTGDLGDSPPPGMTKHPVDRLIPHPSYTPKRGCPDSTFDIGLIHLAQPITDIPPMSYGKLGVPTAGTPCDGVGFGDHTENGQDQFGQKRTATENVMSNDATTILVAAGTGIADHGDSGGPLICGELIVGVTSCHPDGEGSAHTMEYYTRADAVSAWLDGQVALWAAGDGVLRAGLYGSFALVAHKGTVTGSVREGSCEFTLAGQVSPNPIDLTLLTAQDEARMQLTIHDPSTVTISANDELPSGCGTVLDADSLKRGVTFRMGTALSPTVSAFRTVGVNQAFFQNNARHAFVTLGQTVQELGENDSTTGFVNVRYGDPQTGVITSGALNVDDLVGLPFAAPGL
jgi:hypothetical protein